MTCTAFSETQWTTARATGGYFKPSLDGATSHARPEPLGTQKPPFEKLVGGAI